MNREIKFRAFDDGVMLYSHNNTINNSNIQNEWFFNSIREDAIVMQYTGLKDKNGKEIYEGDICTMFTDAPTEVVFKDGAFGYDDQSWYFISFDQNQWFAWKEGASDNIEIIGNIYENPELLQS